MRNLEILRKYPTNFHPFQFLKNKLTDCFGQCRVIYDSVFLQIKSLINAGFLIYHQIWIFFMNLWFPMYLVILSRLHSLDWVSPEIFMQFFLKQQNYLLRLFKYSRIQLWVDISKMFYPSEGRENWLVSKLCKSDEKWPSCSKLKLPFPLFVRHGRIHSVILLGISSGMPARSATLGIHPRFLEGFLQGLLWPLGNTRDSFQGVFTGMYPVIQELLLCFLQNFLLELSS